MQKVESRLIPLALDLLALFSSPLIILEDTVTNPRDIFNQGSPPPRRDDDTLNPDKSILAATPN